MTYTEVVSVIEAAATGWVRSVAAGDVRVLDDEKNAEYPCFGWQQTSSTALAGGDMIRHGFTFFYIDREVRGGGNAVSVQSVGMDALWDIYRRVCEAVGTEAGDIVLTPFRERFADMCCGVFATVDITVQREWLCPTEYTDDDGEVMDRPSGFSGLRYLKQDY